MSATGSDGTTQNWDPSC